MNKISLAEVRIVKIYLDKIDYDQTGMPVVTFEVNEEMVIFKNQQLPQGFVSNLIPNAIVECEIVDGCIVNPKVLHEETKKKEEEIRNRLHNLFKRKK